MREASRLCDDLMAALRTSFVSHIYLPRLPSVMFVLVFVDASLGLIS